MNYINAVIQAAQDRRKVDNPSQLAVALGVSQPALSTWVTGIRYPAGNNAIELATAAGVDPGAFVLWCSVMSQVERAPTAAKQAARVLQKALPKSALTPRHIKANPWR